MRPGIPFTNMMWLFFQHGCVITWPVKCEMKLFIHFRNSNVTPCKFGEGYVIPPILYDGFNNFSMLGLKLIYVSKRGPWWLVWILKGVTIGLNSWLWSVIHQANTCSNDDLMFIENKHTIFSEISITINNQANLRENIILRCRPFCLSN